MRQVRKKVAEGVLHHGMRRVVVSFDDETFAQVRGYAVKQDASFGEAVRQLVEYGLIDIESES